MTHLTDNGADSLADKQKEIGYKVANHIGALLSYWDTDTVCRYANGAFKDWFGISHTDLIGKRMEEAFGEVYKKNVPHIQAVLAGQAQSFEREITIPSGEQKIYLASYYPDIEDGKVIGFYVHSADITEIMLLERQLKASEAKFKNLLDSTPDAMIIMNEQGIMQLVNNKCEDVFGYKKEELVNNHISMLSPKDFNMIQFYKAGSEAIKNAEQPTQSGIIMHGLRKNGQGFPAEVSISPIGMEGSVLLSAAFRDISPNIEKEEFLLKSMAVVSEQNKKLINFAHIVSHNLRSHSGNLEAILQLITETDDEEECAEMMPHLLKISAGFKETVRHLNEIVAIESKRDLTIETLNLHDYVNKALEPLVMDIKNAGIAITNNVPKDMELKYNAAYMDSILLNFITNAIKYRDPKKKPMAEISAYKTDTELVLVIKDNGIGIDLAEYGHKLFGMYNTFTDNPNSTGIGLFMTRNQIESLGGRITVESEEGVGSTFSIHFALDMSAVLKTPQ